MSELEVDKEVAYDAMIQRLTETNPMIKVFLHGHMHLFFA